MTRRADLLAGCDAGARELEQFLDWYEGEDRPTRGNGLLPAEPDPTIPKADLVFDAGRVRDPQHDPYWPAARARRVYIAAPWPLKRAAGVLAAELTRAGLIMTARWIGKPDDTPNTAAEARIDLEDIDDADVVVLMNPAGWEDIGTGGRHFESGYAIAKGKRFFVLGVRSNVFHHLEQVAIVAHADALIAALVPGGIHG